MNKRIRINLQTRYFVQILLVILVSMIGLSLLSVWQFKSAAGEVQNVTSEAIEAHLEEQVRERGRIMTQYLVQNLTNPLFALNLQRMLEYLSTTVAQRDVVFAYVYDAQGAIVHDGSPAIASYGQQLDELLGWDAGATRELHLVRDGEILHIVRPVKLGDEHLGGVAVGLSLDVVAAESAGLRNNLSALTGQRLRKELTYAGIFTLVFVLAGALLALVTGRKLASPIRDLARQARQLGKGDFDHHVVVGRNDEIGDLALAFRGMSQDLESSQKEIEFLAYHDPLTGLPNRASLLDSLAQLCINCRTGKVGGAVLFIDLDDFKPVNDTLGHDAGDALLISTAQRLIDCLDSEPASTWRVGHQGKYSVARLGGDEFTVILENLQDRQQAGIVAAAVLKTLREPFNVNGHEVYIGASIGIATFPEDGRDAETLLAHSDVAMYHAKRRGKHAFHFYEDFMFEETRDKLFMINDLRRALDSEGLTVHYQPIVAAGSGRTIGAEALVRWHHPKRGLIKAAEFIEVAEKSGEIERLGRWALARVCADLAKWRDQGLDGLFVSINISSRQLLREDLPDLVTGLLAQWELGPRDIRIEASEDRIISASGESVSILRKWNEAGFEIWIDQFGSGSASLLNLQRVPARGIKLNPRFIRNVSTDERLRQFVKAVIDMANSLNLEVCAVGVTSEVQAQWLKDNGCRYLQGQFLGPEMNARELPLHLDFKPGKEGPDTRANLEAI